MADVRQQAILTLATAAENYTSFPPATTCPPFPPPRPSRPAQSTASPRSASPPPRPPPPDQARRRRPSHHVPKAAGMPARLTGTGKLAATRSPLGIW
jgi:hypothetical protein